MTQLVLAPAREWLQLLGDLQLQSLQTRLQAPPLSADWSAMHNAASSEFCVAATREEKEEEEKEKKGEGKVEKQECRNELW
ncbi:hypothetical protein LSTR_LSTR011090 [Laodelphax striatellus]|uniref:Uncharacterized protein n=1 Tax=Laodelphax striatellus TaxID=195883 RepID=A0A482WW19_LAOST|nr:hypothetical protein LSTR_LSTR011090 [Laodelphax striatellus]